MKTKEENKKRKEAMIERARRNAWLRREERRLNREFEYAVGKER